MEIYRADIRDTAPGRMLIITRSIETHAMETSSTKVLVRRILTGRGTWTELEKIITSVGLEMAGPLKQLTGAGILQCRLRPTTT